jgi:hypothetical protein
MEIPQELQANEPFAMMRQLMALGLKEDERELLDRLLIVTYALGKIEGALHLLSCSYHSPAPIESAH